MKSVVFTTKAAKCQDLVKSAHESAIFVGIPKNDIDPLLKCLCASYKCFEKGSAIIHGGGASESIGVMLAGAAHVVSEDFWGRRKILARVEGGNLFGEAYAFAGVGKAPVSVIAAEDSEVMFVNRLRVLATCRSACPFHAALIKNLVAILAEKNVELARKIEYVTQPTTRGRLLSYLSDQAHITGSNSFKIPFNREELADFLSVDRSAMSSELSKMRDDGLIAYRKNHFQLLR
jgi:CRP-like cAMP-binding protein